MEFNPKEHPHRRQNLLTGEFVLVSPHRSRRPWLGQIEPADSPGKLTHDPNCYLCPGGTRASGELNPWYEGTYVFTNDFSALTDFQPAAPLGASILQSLPASGTCRVVCFSPRHDLTMAEMTVQEIHRVVETWLEQFLELEDQYRYVQVFENKGEMMGCSNPHPHGQIWASDFVPTSIQRESLLQREYLVSRGENLLLDVVREELESGERIVETNDHWVLFVPFWAMWPFEYLLVPRRSIKRLTQLTPAEKVSLAEILKSGLARYDHLFSSSFPYSMGWHGAPQDGDLDDHWQLHAHFYPPLLRSANVKKFMVGYEMLAESQRDLTPEQAAEMLRSTTG